MARPHGVLAFIVAPATHDKLDRVKALFSSASASCEQMLRELRTGPTATVPPRQTQTWVKK